MVVMDAPLIWRRNKLAVEPASPPGTAPWRRIRCLDFIEALIAVRIVNTFRMAAAAHDDERVNADRHALAIDNARSQSVSGLVQEGRVCSVAEAPPNPWETITMNQSDTGHVRHVRGFAGQYTRRHDPMTNDLYEAAVALPPSLLDQLRAVAKEEGLTAESAAIAAIHEWLDRHARPWEPDLQPKQPLRFDSRDGRYHGKQSDGTMIVIDAEAYGEILRQHERDGMGRAQAELVTADADSWAPDMKGWIDSYPLKRGRVGAFPSRWSEPSLAGLGMLRSG
jgi:hypothetical protein